MKKSIQTSEEMELADQECEPCESGKGKLTGQMIKTFMKQLAGKWKLSGNKRIEQSFKFPDFKKALDFTNQVGEIAEEQGHHPDIFLTYGEVRLQLSTHNAKGLTVNDFILAAKINELK
jgi:4a-hydroxytetrahydrobiopterin dehydratase